MVVDAIEVAFERDHITTFVMCTGDSDFSPLVHKLREMDKRVIGIGVENSTSRLLPPACDEFLFYDRLEGVETGDEPAPSRRGRGRSRRGAAPAPTTDAGSTTGSRTPAPETTADTSLLEEPAPAPAPALEQGDESDDVGHDRSAQVPSLEVDRKSTRLNSSHVANSY